MGIYVPIVQIIDFILLTTTICILIYLLRQQSVFIEHDKQTFRQETFTLIAILCIFDISFMLRLGFDIWLSNNLSKQTFAIAIMAIFTGAVFDVFPICCILFIHSRNFKTIQFGNRYTDEKE